MKHVVFRYAAYCCAICCLGFGLISMTAHKATAEDVAYPGDPLQNITGGGADLAPSGAYGGGWDGTSDRLSGNRVTLNGGVVDYVFGAFTDTPGAAVTNNQVFIKDGTIIDVSGGYSDTGDAVNNTVTISGGVVLGDAIGGNSNSANAIGNTVTISGGSVNGYVFGGYSSTSDAIYNTVTISGSPAFDPVNTDVFGGSGAGIGVDWFTGNTLNVWNYRGSAVANVYNFQFFDFRIPVTQTGPVLTVNGTAMLGDGAGRGSTVTAVNTSGGAPMQPGSSVTLIRAGTLDSTDFTQSRTQGQHGATIRYLWALDASDGQNLIATVANVKAAPEAKVLSEGFLMGLALLNQGGDLLAGRGMADAIRAARKEDQFGYGIFGILSGGWNRYNTGSHVDMAGLSLITGLSFGADLAPGRLTLGAFFEYGTGSYDTYNSFATDYHGKGNISHLGGGVLGRMDFVDTGPGNFYTEASFRAGGLHNDYRNADLRDLNGRGADYDSFSPYYGIHAGLGYIWKFTEQASLDLYGKYFWTRQQGDSVTLKTGDPVKFKDTDSHRLRLGGRLTYAVNEYVSPYIGAAYEHEFDGRQRASTYGYAIDTPTLHGSTGIGELGVTLKPSKDLPLSFDLGVQGYVGKREGVTGSLQVRFEF